MSRALHIAYLALDYPSSFGGSGVGTVVRTLGRQLVARGHRATIVTLGAPGQERESEDGGVCLLRLHEGSFHYYLSRVPGLGGWLALPMRELERSWAGWSVLKHRHAQEPFDIIEITEEAGLFTEMFMGEVPIVGRLHGEAYTFVRHTPGLPLGLGIWLRRLLQRCALRKAKCLISPSLAHAREVGLELAGRCPPIEIIPNPMEIPNAWPRNRPNPAKDGEQIVLYVGRLERRKGIPLLLKAASIVLKEKPGVVFVFAGARHPELPMEEIRDLAKGLGIEKQARFLGHVNHDLLIQWYQRASLCVLPSYYETFGMAALEPMAFGVPVVVTAGGSLSELVVDRVTGFVVPVGDDVALAQAILCLLLDRVLRQSMGHACRERVQAQYGIENVMERNVELYRRVLGLEAGEP